METSQKCWGILNTVHKLKIINNILNVMLPKKGRASVDGINKVLQKDENCQFLLAGLLHVNCLPDLYHQVNQQTASMSSFHLSHMVKHDPPIACINMLHRSTSNAEKCIYNPAYFVCQFFLIKLS